MREDFDRIATLTSTNIKESQLLSRNLETNFHINELFICLVNRCYQNAKTILSTRKQHPPRELYDAKFGNILQYIKSRCRKGMNIILRQAFIDTYDPEHAEKARNVLELSDDDVMDVLCWSIIPYLNNEHALSRFIHYYRRYIAHYKDVEGKTPVHMRNNIVSIDPIISCMYQYHSDLSKLIHNIGSRSPVGHLSLICSQRGNYEMLSAYHRAESKHRMKKWMHRSHEKEDLTDIDIHTAH